MKFLNDLFLVGQKLLLESRYWTLLFTASVAVSIMLGFSAVVLIYCAYDL
jgi:hypothetical protein